VTFRKRYADFVARLRVPGGFLLAAAFVWLSQPTAESLAWGLPVSFAGILIRAWAAGHLAKNKQLATTGPYAYTRNPLYLGTLLVAGGLSIAAHSAWLALVFGAAFFFIYVPVIELEEQHLRKLFPEYALYAERVPRLGVRFQASPGGQFRWNLYLKNQEYQALAGYLSGVLFLYWKVI
jgi:protein-S-isoprenylcysteine O-methyltransferase Ste14